MLSKFETEVIAREAAAKGMEPNAFAANFFYQLAMRLNDDEVFDAIHELIKKHIPSFEEEFEAWVDEEDFVLAYNAYMGAKFGG